MHLVDSLCTSWDKEVVILTILGRGINPYAISANHRPTGAQRRLKINYWNGPRLGFQEGGRGGGSLYFCFNLQSHGCGCGALQPTPPSRGLEFSNTSWCNAELQIWGILNRWITKTKATRFQFSILDVGKIIFGDWNKNPNLALWEHAKSQGRWWQARLRGIGKGTAASRKGAGRND